MAGAAVSYFSSDKAADAQAGGSKRALELQRYMYDTTRSDLMPWRNTGIQAMGQLGSIYGFDPNYDPSFDPSRALSAEQMAQVDAIIKQGADNKLGKKGRRLVNAQFGSEGLRYAQSPYDYKTGMETARTRQQTAAAGGNKPNYDAFFQSPDYQFRLSQGVNSLDRSAASRGRLRSGSHAKALTEFGQNIGAAEFGNYFNRMLALSGGGQAATNSLAQAGQNFANAGSNSLMAAGDARASGYLTAGIGINNALSGAGNMMAAYAGG